MESISRDDVMPLEELCELLGLSRTTVLRRARAGSIPCVKGATRTPLFLRREISEWLQGHSTGEQGRAA